MLLDQERADECQLLLQLFVQGSTDGVVTDFAIDSITLIMENEGKTPSEIQLFLSSLLGYHTLKIYFLSIIDRIEATRHMESLKLDFDDATAYQAMKILNVVQIISFDKHFDKVPEITRIEPHELQTDNAPGKPPDSWASGST